jgi:hypothetical protein
VTGSTSAASAASVSAARRLLYTAFNSVNRALAGLIILLLRPTVEAALLASCAGQRARVGHRFCGRDNVTL